MKNIITTLRERGLIEAMTNEELELICQNPTKVYIGFDPTADSLHIGNLVGIVTLAWFQKFGHTPVAVVGGATGMIGDPSGKSSERNLLDENTIQTNLKGIKKSLEAVLDFDHPTVKPLIVNNHDWFKSYSYIDFLRDIGKNFRVGTMMARESVKNRMNSDEGISYTEFSYQILQAYDFLYLFDNFQVQLQLGGSDQWGNITAGTDLIRRLRNKSAHGVTFPLLTRSDGKKFGKTEEGTIWLNSEKLSAYDFYQYLIRIPDADVIKLMRMLTFMEMSEIRDYEQKMKSSDYVPNSAQKRLAEEITTMIHGKEGLETAQKITQGAAPGAKTDLSITTLQALSKEIDTHDLPINEIVGSTMVDLLSKTKIQTSKGEARRLITNGGCYLNNEKIDNENFVIETKHLIEGKILLLGIGKKKKVILQVSEKK